MKILPFLFVLMLSLDWGMISPQDAIAEEIMVENRGGMNGEVFIKSRDGSNERLLSSGYDPSLSSDMKRVVFLRKGNLHIINIDGSGEEELLNEIEFSNLFHRGSARYPFLTPDNSIIFFTWKIGFKYDTYAVNIDGSDPHLILNGGILSRNSWPSPFSPDGTKVLVTTCTDEGHCLQILSLADGNISEITPLTSTGSWSPNGQKIAFTRDQLFSDEVDLFIFDIDSRELTDLLALVTEVDATTLLPVGAVSWSSDGLKIAFNQRGSADIYTLQIDGKGLMKADAHFSGRYSDPPTFLKPISWSTIKSRY